GLARGSSASSPLIVRIQRNGGAAVDYLSRAHHESDIVMAGAASELVVIVHIHETEIGGFARRDGAGHVRVAQRTGGVVSCGDNGFFGRHPESITGQIEKELRIEG